MEILLWTIVGALLLQLAFTVWNLRQLPSVGGTGEGRSWLDQPADGKNGSAVRLSVLIPARNEAHQIADCVRSALADPSGAIEVIVLDDRSEDGTGEAAGKAGKGDGRLRILEGKPLADGWLGKSYACRQLADEAAGEWWLFLDADARLTEGALGDLMDTALQQGSGLVTGFPYQETGSWLERLIVPLMSFSIACHLPIRLVRHSRDPKFVAAHGACMLIHRSAYLQTGGHEAFKSHLVDDMQLARAVKAAGLPVTLADVCPQVRMRMYRSAAEVWSGYKKNIYAGVGRNPALMSAVILMYALLYLVPPIATIIAALPVSAAAGDLALPGLLGWVTGAAVKRASDRRSRQPAFLCLLLPVSIAMLIGIAVASWHASASGAGYVWKGRRYS